jgi:hypothetical protein
MSETSRPSVADVLADPQVIEAAVRRGVRAAVLAHARAGNPVAAWRDGQVVWLPPAEILARFTAEDKGASTPEG